MQGTSFFTCSRRYLKANIILRGLNAPEQSASIVGTTFLLCKCPWLITPLILPCTFRYCTSLAFSSSAAAHQMYCKNRTRQAKLYECDNQKTNRLSLWASHGTGRTKRNWENELPGNYRLMQLGGMLMRTSGCSCNSNILVAFPSQNRWYAHYAGIISFSCE